ncbi:MAG TPA: DNA topoisomerase IV subunit A [Rhodocyclaceae bacterium]|nr:DNA topoisomerase IV subunit A [Rhodocyclaceae bacterium]
MHRTIDDKTPDFFTDDGAAKNPESAVADPAAVVEEGLPDGDSPGLQKNHDNAASELAPDDLTGEPPESDGGGGDDLPPEPLMAPPDEPLPAAQYAARRYLEYAMSVVTGRALPDVADGQKPVQRRILFDMHRMGLTNSPRHVKSARVVGDVIGKYHPHGDSAVYEAMVRMAQSWTLRYPLVDGQGNFGSRDGDSAAAMRYTECKLRPIADLLLSEIDRGTVDFRGNYDGSQSEPALLPARLPFVLLNGASGIAVGMATEIPPHNLTEVAAAAAAMIRNPELSDDELHTLIPGPDFPGGGQLISSPHEIRTAYASGRGSVRVRARWTVEALARGQWRIAVTEMPPGVSCAQVAAEIEAVSNPVAKEKNGKKYFTPEQQNLKAVFLGAIDLVRDESDKDHSVRLVIEPKSSRQEPEDLMRLLLAHTSLECNASINMTMLGLDGNPTTKSLRKIVEEWCAFRIQTVRRRTQHRLGEVERRIHILEGRMAILLNIDEVIHCIRNSDDPKADLMARFELSEVQAEDILEIRLRQLARLEGIKIEKELGQLNKELKGLQRVLGSEKALRELVVKEIEEDAKTYGDARRTVIEAAERITQSEAKPVIDEPVTVIVSKNGWLRSRQGHDFDISTLSFKEGDSLLGAFRTRTTASIVILDSNGRAYSVPAIVAPGGRGDGAPVTSLVEIQDGGKIVAAHVGQPEEKLLVAGEKGYGFIASVADMTARGKAGKAFLSLEAGEKPLAPVPLAGVAEIACVSSDGRGLVFGLGEVKEMPRGKGVKLMEIEGKQKLTVFAVIDGAAPGIKADRLPMLRASRAGKGRKLK